MENDSQGRFWKAGAILVVVMGLSMMVQGGTLSGLNSKVTGTLMVENTDVDKKNTDETQYITSTLQSGRSYPDITVKAGEPVKVDGRGPGWKCQWMQL